MQRARKSLYTQEVTTISSSRHLGPRYRSQTAVLSDAARRAMARGPSVPGAALLRADCRRQTPSSLKVDVNMPDVYGTAPAVVVVVPGLDVVRPPSIQPGLHILAELPMPEVSPAPDSPVLYVSRELVRILVWLDEHVTPPENLLEHEFLPVAAIGLVHPGQPLVLPLGNLFSALPWPDTNGPHRSPCRRGRLSARWRFTIARVSGPLAWRSGSWGWVQIHIQLRIGPLEAPL
mmetsp:Transcript_29257/g.63624  ORF Transcript_29257/g.63624 Transcript_29257/m.63624 type:complete len:233 (-) Transcript_29257:631-1329(-)